MHRNVMKFLISDEDAAADPIMATPCEKCGSARIAAEAAAYGHKCENCVHKSHKHCVTHIPPRVK
jgi:uncharacterized OB-fold protein